MGDTTPPTAAVRDAARLAALRATELLDSGAEEAFDRLTRLAGKILKAPVALVSLVDADRQYFKSCVGLPEPLATVRETPLSHSFCQHVVASRTPLVVHDAREHPLLCDNLAIPDLGVIAYAGIPITTSAGDTLGSFCVIDGRPRVWTDDEVDTLRELTASVVAEIELRLLARQVVHEHDEKAALLDTAAQGLYGLDRDGNITFINRAGAEMLGYTPAELAGRPAHAILHTPPSAPAVTEGTCPLEPATRHDGVNPHGRDALWRSDGSPLPVSYAVRAIVRDGQPAGAVVSFADDTERRRAEEALRASERFARSALDALPENLAILDSEGTVVAVNQAWRAFGVGWPEDACEGSNYLALCDRIAATGSAEAAQFAAGIRDVIAGRRDRYEIEYAWHTRRERCWFLSRVSPFLDGERSLVIVSHTPITDLKLAEEALRGREEWFRALVQHSSDVVTVNDAEGMIRYASESTERVLGYRPEEMIGLPSFAFLHPDDLARMRSELQKTVAGDDKRAPREMRIRHKDGSWRAFEAVTTNLLDRPEIRGIVVTGRDITERKRAEAEMRLRDRALAATGNGVCIASATLPDMPVLYINAAFERMTGYTAAETVGRNCRFLQGPETDPATVETMRAALVARRECSAVLLNYTKDGRPFWNQLTLSPVTDDNGEVTHFVGVQVDVSERVRATQDLRESEARFRLLAENSTDLIARHDADGRYLYASPACLPVLGYTPRELEGRSLDDLVHPEDLTRVQGERARLLQTPGTGTITYRVRRKDGETVCMETTARSVHDGPAAEIQSTSRDITARRAAEEALLLSDAVLSQMPDAVIVTDLKGRIRRWTGSAQRMFGYTGEEARGRSIGFLRHPDQTATATTVLSIVAERGVYIGEMLCRTREGRAVPVETTVSTVYGADASPMAYITINRDISERQAADERLRAEQGISETLYKVGRTVAAELDLHKVVQAVTDAATALLGATVGILSFDSASEDAVRRPYALSGTDARRWVNGEMQASDAEPEGAGGPGHPELRSRLIVPIVSRSGEDLGTLFFGHPDLHVFSEREERLASGIAAQAAIAIDNARLYQQARDARDEADMANRAKSEFLSRMSHELRTPLNAILGFGQLLQMDALEDEQAEHTEHIVRAGRHLLDLINEVLEIARIEAGRLDLALGPVRVEEAATGVRDLLAPLAAQRGIHCVVRCQPPCGGWVQADPQRLKQVLLNLIANAIKYNHDGGEVHVHCSDAGDGRLRIGVTDTGPGIAQEKHARLFTPFERLGAEGRGVEGTGLGLSLARLLVEAMGGTIGVESRVGQGSTFWVELPSVSAPALTASAARTATMEDTHDKGDTPQATVLYIEDNVSNLALIERVFRRRPDLRLMTAVQGRIGLHLAREHRPALILLDMHLPDLDGEEVLRELRAAVETADTPVVMVSADAIPSQIERLLAGGATDYVTKPIDLRNLLALIGRLIPPSRTSEGG